MPSCSNLEFNGSYNATSTESFSNSSDGEHVVGIYRTVELCSAVVLLMFSPITVFTNGLFLYALCRNSLKCFRKSTPTTAFVAGLSLADLITGFLVEPVFASYYILHYWKPTSNAFHVAKLSYNIGGAISTTAISVSFVIVLAMSLSQYIAICRPHNYKNIVTTKRVICLQGASGLYFLGFSLLQYTGISRQKFLLLDVILHPTLISCLLVVVHVLMRRAFNQHVIKRRRKNQGLKQSLESGNQTETKLLSMKSIPCNLPRPRSIPGILHDVPCPIHSSVVANSRPATIRGGGNKTRKYKSSIELTAVLNGNATPHLSSLSVSPLIQKPLNGPHLPVGSRIAGSSSTSFVSQGNDNSDENIRLRSSPRQKRKKPPIEKQFAIMTFYLSAILLASSISHTFVFYVFLLKKPSSFEENVYIHIALRITDLMLFFKVFLDAFIFAWRLPAFRKYLMLTISCGRIKLQV